MSTGGRARARGRILKRTALIAAALVVLTLLFVVTGNWVLAIIAGVPAAVAVWVYLQARTVR
jgi:4-hydroxybenzoate polyprenyltransferase